MPLTGKMCLQGVGSGGAPEIGGVAPAANVAVTGSVGWLGIPKVMLASGTPVPAAGGTLVVAGGAGKPLTVVEEVTAAVVPVLAGGAGAEPDDDDAEDDGTDGDGVPEVREVEAVTT